MNKTRMLTTMAVLVAIGTIGAQFLWFPAGFAKAYPVQHAVNVIAAVTLGPVPAVTIALVIGILRNMLGLGTLLAFPGGMIGALLAGYMYQWTGKKGFAAGGEIIGTGIIGALFAVPYAKLLMGQSIGAFFFLPGFLVSTLAGAAIALLLLFKLESATALPRRM